MMKSKLLWWQIAGFALLLIMGQTAQAGYWVVDRYEYEEFSEDVELRDDITYTHGPAREMRRYRGSPSRPPQIERASLPSSNHTGHLLSAESSARMYIWLYEAGAQGLKAKTSLAATPVYKWYGEGEPLREFWVREFSNLAIGRYTHGEGVSFDEQNPYLGEGFTITRAYNGFENIPVGPGSVHHPRDWWLRVLWHNAMNNIGLESPWYIRKISVGEGVTEVRGPTRHLAAEMEFSGAAGGSMQYWHAGAHAKYRSEVVHFGIGVDLHGYQREEFGFLNDPADPNSGIYTLPYNRSFAAYAEKNWTNKWTGQLSPPSPLMLGYEAARAQYEADMARPIKPFWDGRVGYSADLSQNLRGMLANKEYTPQFEWKRGEDYPLSKDLVVTASPYSPSEIIERQLIATDTKDKDLHHNVQEYPVGDHETESYSLSEAEWPRSTKTEVKVNFGYPASATSLEARARIDWYYQPSTYYAVEIETTYIDLVTGREVVAEVDFEDPADAYAAEVQAAYNEFFAAHDRYVGTPLRAAEATYELAFAVLIPDEVDLVVSAIPVAGQAVSGLRKVYKASKGLERFTEITSKVGLKMAAKSDDILAAGRVALNVASGHPVVVKTKYRLIRMKRVGKMDKDGVRDDVPLGVVKKETRFLGPFCFTAGTPIVMADGTLKPIEQVRVGDAVLSKDEDTGEVAPKRVSHITQRQAPSTLALTFSNGEVIETTAEHPFYEEHKGFTPAGLLAIGNSIVTRAGPLLEITAIEERRTPAKVYNFTVEEFHTYFVGSSAVWVHNAFCHIWNAATANADELQDLPLSRRPGTSGAMELNNGEVLTGASKFKDETVEQFQARVDPDGIVKQLYDNVTGARGVGHGSCAEYAIIAQILYGGKIATGAKSVSALVRSAGNGNHRKAIPACHSCTQVLAHLHIEDMYKVAKKLAED